MSLSNSNLPSSVNLPISLYDSATKSLVPLTDSFVTWYCCGPTIYDSAHLGHALTYVNFDIVRRVLEHYGYTVYYCMNITDVDDKIQNKIKNTGVTHAELISKYEKEFKEDMNALNVKPPTSVIRVTENIDTIQNYIAEILKKGLAYVSNSSVYIDSQEYLKRGYTWDHFGHCNYKVYENTYQDDKKDPRDFCLWKLASDDDTVKYSSAIFSLDTQGKPGWHIECSAMCHKLLGNKFTLHSGGIDLIFPHHNNECIQNAAYSDGAAKVDIFIHTGHLHIDAKKWVNQ